MVAATVRGLGSPCTPFRLHAQAYVGPGVRLVPGLGSHKADTTPTFRPTDSKRDACVQKLREQTKGNRPPSMHMFCFHFYIICILWCTPPSHSSTCRDLQTSPTSVPPNAPLDPTRTLFRACGVTNEAVIWAALAHSCTCTCKCVLIACLLDVERGVPIHVVEVHPTCTSSSKRLPTQTQDPRAVQCRFDRRACKHLNVTREMY
mmetsp:Transcript_98755/g.170110  ORF Transcript_98755/g.170110 Transcript_98755/m.170110 type:complete len:204 (+) Transcript_98755:62-673(+)